MRSCAMARLNASINAPVVVLEYCGYKTDLLEFIDIEHSPKNILIRAVKKPVSEEKRERAKAEAERLCRTFGIHQTLMQLVLAEERSHS